MALVPRAALIRRWHGWEYDEVGGLDEEIRVIFDEGTTATPSHAGPVQAVLSTYGLDDAARVELFERWRAWWGPRYGSPPPDA